MKKCYRYWTTMLMGAMLSVAAYAQSVTITGTIRSGSSKEALPSVSVTIKGSSAGTFTDSRGNFKLITSKQLPFTIVITSVGFESKEVQVTSAGSIPQVELASASSLGTEVVVSASRVPERILESPVTIERINTAAIHNTASTSYYDMIRNIKGVDVTTASLTFNSVTTRGFNGSGNLRFNQFVDGMDNQAPGLNFSVGSVVGLNELDVDNMELLPGASSALYGSGGMNGTLLINSKDPFKYQGLSVQIKQGIMHTGSNDPVGASPYYDWAFRWGQKVSEKFAFKIGAQFIQAKDWQANDSTDYTGLGTLGKPIAGTRATDPNYNGVNRYGDETSLDIRAGSTPFLQGAAQQIILANPAYAPAVGAILASDAANPFFVSRTGYKEGEIINNTTLDVKLNGALYYKITPSVEAIATANYGTGNSVYTGSDRYSLKDLKIGQYKLEVKGNNWFIRSYTTQENSGQAFNATVTAQLFNEAWKPSYNPANPAASWYPQYAGAYLLARLSGATPLAANNAARASADVGRPSTAIGNPLFDQVRSLPIPKGGLFLDRTSLYHTEGQYSFTQWSKVLDVIAGASWRQYILNSQGTLFADSAGRIHTNEYGAYVQASKKLFDDQLKLTASGRYDKNDNFKGKLTPRFSAVWTVAKDQNIRASYQNAYRFPSNQNQWINLNTGAGILIGGLPSLRTFYHFDTNPVLNASTGQVQNFGEYKPESSNSYELGYKGLFEKRLLIDVYGYYSKYKDFIGRVSVIQSKSGNPATINPADPTTYTGYSVSANSANTVSTYGAGLGIDYILRNNFSLNFNLTSDNINNPDPTFATYWNTPKYRTNLGISNTGFGYDNRFSFCAQYRWQDTYYTESDFKQGNTPAFSTIDAQVSYKVPNIKSLIKLGGTNILNHYYTTAFGNPSIGAVYYVSYAYNIF
ncbi:MAG TPA: TonB-dependent receptor [Chitinophagaceae bacterium]|jgi:outer membrane receptor protein involved in Fe transport